jgi:hypothetical protein
MHAGEGVDPWPRAVQEIAARCRRAFDGLIQVFAAPTDTLGQLARRPAPDAWSALEIGEHVLLADHYLMLLARKVAEKSAQRAAGGATWPAHAPAFEHLEALSEQPRPWRNPEHMTPGGKLDAASIRRDLARDRDELLALLASMPPGQGTLHRIRMSVVQGDDRLDLYQFVLVIVLHAERHLAGVSRRLGGA